MRSSKLQRIGAGFAVLALGLAACSSEEPTTDATDGPSESSSDTSEPVAAPEMDPHESDGVFQIGLLLPQTGGLQAFGPGMIGGAQLAVNEINDAGGVLGTELVLADVRDESSDPAKAAESAASLVGQGVDAIIGAASSGQSLAVIEGVTGAGVAQCSGSNTSPTFTNFDDGGLYIRTAPTDALQGPVLADLIAGDGYTQVAILARGDDYGQGLLDATKAALEGLDVEVVYDETVDPEAADFSAQVQAIADSGAEAVALLTFVEETPPIISGLLEAEFPADAIYGADGLQNDELASKVNPDDPSVLAGMQGTGPSLAASDEYLERLRAVNDAIGDNTAYSAQKYDCVVLLALGAEAAGNDNPTEIVENAISLSSGTVECAGFVACRDALADGASVEELNYVGESGSVDLNDVGEPASGTFAVWRIADDGSVEEVRVEQSS